MEAIKTERLAIVSIQAPDIPATAHFYRDVLGLRLVPEHGHRIAFDLGGLALVIVEGQPAKVEPGSGSFFPVLAFAVEDIERAAEGLHAHGVKLVGGIHEGLGTRWVYFYDPGGNLVELAEFGEGAHIA
jgi:catechol 2,3-dioxygenase-like lactoylglutathione lyase family enzyme